MKDDFLWNSSLNLFFHHIGSRLLSYHLDFYEMKRNLDARHLLLIE